MPIISNLDQAFTMGSPNSTLTITYDVEWEEGNERHRFDETVLVRTEDRGTGFHIAPFLGFENGTVVGGPAGQTTSHEVIVIHPNEDWDEDSNGRDEFSYVISLAPATAEVVATSNEVRTNI